MQPGRRVCCDTCGWWGGHSLNCAELSKPNFNSGLRDNPLVWEDAPAQDVTSSSSGGQNDTSKPAKQSQSFDATVAAKTLGSIGSATTQQRLKPLQSTRRVDSVLQSEKPPDMSKVGQRTMVATFHKCNCCKIKVPSADIPTQQKPCHFCKKGLLQQLGKDGNPLPIVEDAELSNSDPKRESLSRANDELIRKKAMTFKGTVSIPMTINLSEYTDICGDRSVWKKVIREGTGGKPESGSSVVVHYTGKLPETSEIFDTSTGKPSPFAFVLGVGVIQGWNDGVSTMRKGELAHFLIQPSKGYGSRGSPSGSIPPNKALFFEIELLEWMDTKQQQTNMNEGSKSASSARNDNRSSDDDTGRCILM